MSYLWRHHLSVYLVLVKALPWAISPVCDPVTLGLEWHISGVELGCYIGDLCPQAKEHLNGVELDGRRLRVDYSITKRPHTPTPGVYMGRPTRTSDDRSDRHDRGDRGYDGRDRYYDDYGSSRGYGGKF